MGRKTKYKPEYANRVYDLCFSGYTDEQVARKLGINPDTLYQWKKKYPEFSEAMERGKEKPDLEVVQALYRRAIGFKLKATKHFHNNGQIITVEYDEFYPPNVSAIKTWLSNRMRDQWSAKRPDEVDPNQVPGLAVLAKAITDSPNTYQPPPPQPLQLTEGEAESPPANADETPKE